MVTIVPASRPSMPARILRSVDLPVPLAPTMPARSLGVTSQSRFSKSVLGPKRLAAPVSWIIWAWGGVKVHCSGIGWGVGDGRWGVGEVFLPNKANDVKRSEEHTSELQSLRHLVCRLLLEKMKRYFRQ